MKLLEVSAAADLTTELALAVLRWDRQREKISLGPLNLALYDEFLDGGIERRLYYDDVIVRIAGPLVDHFGPPELRDPVDIHVVLRELSSESTTRFIEVLRDRLILRLYQHKNLARDLKAATDRDDPLNLLPTLKRLSRSELERVDEVLAHWMPARGRGRPRDSLLNIDLNDLEFWRLVNEYAKIHESVGTACAAAAHVLGDRNSPPNSLRTRYRRLNRSIQRLKAHLTRP